jgi:thioesterase domain-containing protein
MAAELQRRGHRVALLALLDSAPAGHLLEQGVPTPAAIRDYFAGHLIGPTGEEEYQTFVDRAVSVIVNHGALLPEFTSPVYDGDVLLFTAVPRPGGSPAGRWRPYVRGAVHQYDIHSGHEDLYLPGPAAEICQVISARLASNESDLPT